MNERGKDEIIRYKYDACDGENKKQPEDWEECKCDPSQFSYLWENQSQFEPKRFAQNQCRRKKCNDAFFKVFFRIHLLSTLFVFALLFELLDKPKDCDIKAIFMILLLVSTFSTLKHSLHAIKYPDALANFEVRMSIAIICCMSISNTFIFNESMFLIFLPTSLIIWIISGCIKKKHALISTSILKQLWELIIANSNIFAPLTVFVIIDIVVNIAFLFFSLYSLHTRSPVPLMYTIFSYSWIMTTFSYFSYMTSACFTAFWYFLRDTEYMPKSPVLMSFDYVISNSYGSAAFAGMIHPITNVLSSLVDILNAIISKLKGENKHDNVNNQSMDQYGLIYSAIFGVPYKEGCRRWKEVSSKKSIDVLNNSYANNTVVKANLFILSIFVSSTFYCTENDFSYVLVVIIFQLFAFVLTFFLIFEQPIKAVSNAFFVCFVESPNRLKLSSPKLYNIMNELFKESQ